MINNTAVLFAKLMISSSTTMIPSSLSFFLTPHLWPGWGPWGLFTVPSGAFWLKDFVKSWSMLQVYWVECLPELLRQTTSILSSSLLQIICVCRFRRQAFELTLIPPRSLVVDNVYRLTWEGATHVLFCAANVSGHKIHHGSAVKSFSRFFVSN